MTDTPTSPAPRAQETAEQCATRMVDQIVRLEGSRLVRIHAFAAILEQRDAETRRAAIGEAAGWHDDRARQAERDGNGAMAYRHRFYASEIRSAASADSRKVGEDV